MTSLSYGKILSAAVGDEKIQYGILFGNEKIVFIKSGAGGNIRGYQDKYLKMAHRVHKNLGATVICASNGDLDGKIQLKADKALIEKVISSRGFEHYELYFVGTSDGGEHSLKLSGQFTQTSKFLGINSSCSNADDFVNRIQSLPRQKKIFVYGAEDIDSHDIVPRLKTLVCDNLELVVLDGVDHNFTDKVDDFINLIDFL